MLLKFFFYITELGNKVTAASTYVGSFFQASSWYSGNKEKEKEGKEEKERKEGKNDNQEKEEKAPSASSSFSSAFFNTLGGFSIVIKINGPDNLKKILVLVKLNYIF